ncbi:MAG: tryptophan--tRNA ligase [Clostridiaceae bacterium]|nr:tryptophan--tRNA ligase [Eubacteriales bacterium]
MESKKRILTGDRTTGKLHLGHYVGSLQNRVKLQAQYETFILLADVQALTTHFENPELIGRSIFDVAIDNLSVGLDPERITLVQQSGVSAIAELTVFYSMLVPVNVLRHNPTIKTEARQYGYNDLTYGFLGYPVSQTADITFCNADLVPVGEDQLPHLELSRKIVRRFNDLYGKGNAILHVPEPLLSDTPRLTGLDGGGKMGKSLGNAIYLADDEATVREKVRNAVTDTNRIAVSDKGNPDVCSVSKYHRAFNPGEYDDICEMCRNARIGCVVCKKNLSDKLNALLFPVRDRRKYYEGHTGLIKEYIYEGTRKANGIGLELMAEVKKAMGISLEQAF